MAARPRDPPRPMERIRRALSESARTGAGIRDVRLLVSGARGLTHRDGRVVGAARRSNDPSPGPDEGTGPAVSPAVDPRLRTVADLRGYRRGDHRRGRHRD